MVLPVPLFIYITVASQIATVASLQRSLDSLSVLLGFELHSHGVPRTTGSPAMGGGQPMARGVGRWISPRASSLAGERKAAPSSTLASSLRAEQKWVRAKRAAVTELPQESNSATTSLLRQNNLNEIRQSGQSPLLGAVPLSQQQCLRTIASPSTHLHPCGPASQRCARHIFKAP